MKKLIMAMVLITAAIQAKAGICITEWMYDGCEFIELTNTGSTAVDMTGWSFDDDSRTAGTVSLSAFGVIAAGESVILSESSASNFRSLWGLDSSVKVIGGNSANLGKADEINIYDSAGNLVDRLTYSNDVNVTKKVSGNITAVNLGENDYTAAVLSAASDVYGSYVVSDSKGSYTANPGAYPIPEPTTLAILGLGVLSLRSKKI